MGTVLEHGTLAGKHRGCRCADCSAQSIPEPRLSKEQAPCCVASRDALGRLPIGFCSPGCIRRPAVKS